jgi:cyclophilin family peptidyl-prolyl cis-trans isomerase
MKAVAALLAVASSLHGADRFYNLVRHGFYDGTRFFRVVRGRWAQFGIHGTPQIASVWRSATIPDDPRRVSNRRGTVAYAFAVPGGRTTQVFFNLALFAGGNAYLMHEFPRLDWIERAVVVRSVEAGRDCRPEE